MECQCFTLCSQAAAADFINRMPSVVTADPDDPWHEYLDAVYGGEVAYPFDLSSLRYLEFNTPAWQERHPTARWPVQTCEHHRRGDWLRAYPPNLPRCADCEHRWSRLLTRSSWTHNITVDFVTDGELAPSTGVSHRLLPICTPSASRT